MRLVASSILFFAGSALAQPLPQLAPRLAFGRDVMSQRRAIRGETISVHESEELAAMRRFEEERFGAERKREMGPEQSPGSDEDSDENSEKTDPFVGLVPPDLAKHVPHDPHLLRFLDFYKNERRGRSIMRAWLARQGRYREMIESALEHHHLPHALLYVAMIESGYDPHDRSSVGASGVWQFMPEGARIYGLRIDNWVDERDDPEKATDAVMRYLGDLHARFGSWHLALAAFNAGYGAVLSSVARYNTNDYFELCRHENGLPWETTLYVPKVLATAFVGGNRKAFGFDDVVPDPPWTFDRVTVPAATTLANVAQAAGTTLDAVVALNPELKHWRTPPEPWLIRVPRGTGARFTSLFRVREPVVPYRVKLGDRVETIAKAHRISKAVLMRLNGIKDAQEVRPGEVLVLPADAKEEAKKAARSDESADEKGGDDDDAQVVAVPDREQSVAEKKQIFYRVAPGDGISEVARFFGVSEEDLARWNKIDPDARLIASLILQVWVDPDFDPKTSAPAVLDAAHLKLVTVGSDEFLDLMEARKGRRRATYVVATGDTLKRIGARVGLSEGDLERINRLGRQTELTVGQKLTIYLPVPLQKHGHEAVATDAGPLPIESLPTALPPPLPTALADDLLATTDLATAPPLLPPQLAPPKVTLDDAPTSDLIQPPPADDPSFPEALPDPSTSDSPSLPVTVKKKSDEQRREDQRATATRKYARRR